MHVMVGVDQSSLIRLPFYFYCPLHNNMRSEFNLKNELFISCVGVLLFVKIHNWFCSSHSSCFCVPLEPLLSYVLCVCVLDRERNGKHQWELSRVSTFYIEVEEKFCMCQICNRCQEARHDVDVLSFSRFREQMTNVWGCTHTKTLIVSGK